MAEIELFYLAHSRTGDKGDSQTMSLIPYSAEDYALIEQQITAEAVKKHFGNMVKGDVERFDLPNLHALNFLLHARLGGGGTLSLMTDAQGKTFSTALLRMFIEIPDDDAGRLVPST